MGASNMVFEDLFGITLQIASHCSTGTNVCGRQHRERHGLGTLPPPGRKPGVCCRRPWLLSTVHRLTGWKARSAIIYRLPTPPSIVCVRHLSRGLRSAVRIRLFVPHSLTVCHRLMGWKARPILYHSFRKFAASRPKAMKNPPSPVIASAAHVPPATSKAWWSVAWGKQSLDQ
jgi:hypothetical protein